MMSVSSADHHMTEIDNDAESDCNPIVERRGWIALERGILDHRLLGPKKPYSYFEAWCWLLFEAAWKPRRKGVVNPHGARVVINLQRGQLSHSLRFMAEAWGWTVKRVRSFLQLLQRESAVGLEKGTPRGTVQTVITICNYEHYQNAERAKGTAKGTPRARQGHKLEQVNKETKESKKEKTGKMLLPDDWHPSNSHYDLAASKGLSREEVLEAGCEMRDWSLGNGERRNNWDSVFSNWIRRNANKFRGNKHHENPERSVIAAADRLQLKLAELNRPAPNFCGTGGVRGPTGAAVVRLLPKGGRQ